MPASQQTLLRKIQIDRQSDYLVTLAGGAMSPDMVDNHLKQTKAMSQLNAALGVSLETDSPEVVINWLLYQMGRPKEPGDVWKKSGLGKKVADALDKDLRSQAKVITSAVLSGSEVEEERQEQNRQIHIKLIRRYLGYLKRWYVARGGQQ